MKKINYIISLILALIMVFGLGCQGCQQCAPDNSNGENTQQIEVLDTYLVERGKTEYSIVIPQNFTAREATAKNELLLFFKEATGIVLPVTTDNAVDYTEDSKFICIGNTTIAEEVNLVPTYEVLGENGFIIKTIGNSIFLLGYTDFGTLYSVYGFLEREFDYDYYTVDSYSLTKIKNDVKVKNYDIVDVPDINMFETNYGYAQKDPTVANRYRAMSRTEIFVPIDGVGTVHNTLSYFPKSTYGEYDYFYTPDGTDICFSARGVEAQFEFMTDCARDEIINEFKGGQNGVLMIIGQQDINKTCTCAHCVEVANVYGAASANGIIFCNRVLEKIYAWFETDDGKPYARNFYMLLLAYEKFVNAPVTEINGEYVVNNNLKVHEKFGVISAPIGNDFTISKAENPDQYKHYSEWAAISNVFSLYAYDTNYQDYLCPFNTFDSKQDLYQEMVKVNCISLFDHSQSNNMGLASAWSMLKMYLESKLRWDTSIDMNKYTEKYFYGVYGKDAAEHMMNVYYSFRAHWNYLKEEIAQGRIENQKINAHMQVMVSRKLWSLNLLEGWLAEMNTAVEKIEPLKTTNPAEYERIYKMIAAERMSPVYLILRLYTSYYSDSYVVELAKKFRADTTLCNVSCLGPISKTVNGVLSQWGV